MNDNVVLLLCYILCPLIMLILGFFLWRFPPQYGAVLGYRTSMSQKNQLTWDTAQMLFGKITLTIFVIVTALSALVGAAGVIMDFDEGLATTTFMIVEAVQIAAIFAAIAVTEALLVKKFDKNGNPK